MSDLRRLIGTVRYAGMRFAVDGDQLIVTGNTARLTPDLNAKIKRHKWEIIAALSRLPAHCVALQACMDIGACGPGVCEQSREYSESRAELGRRNGQAPCIERQMPRLIGVEVDSKVRGHENYDRHPGSGPVPT